MTAVLDEAQAELTRIRTWAAEHCFDGDPIRQAHYTMALSSHVHRLIKFGPDGALETLTARDLMHLLIYLNGSYAEWILRTAFTRALIEGDQEVVDFLAGIQFMPEVRLWYHRLCEGLLNGIQDALVHQDWVAGLNGESLAIARLVSARLYPDTAQFSWLTDAPQHPQLQAALAAVLLVGQPKYRHAVETWLRAHPVVRCWLL